MKPLMYSVEPKLVSNVLFSWFGFVTVSASNILSIFPVPFRDHQVVFRPLIENLLEQGHNVTVVTTDPNNFAVTNEANVGNTQLEIIDLSFVHNLKVLDSLKSHENMLSGSDMLRTAFHVMRTVAEAELKSFQMQKLLNVDHGQKRFDAVLVDWSGPALMNAFANKFKVPLIGITPGGAFITSHEAIGNPNHPVAIPSILMPFSEDLSLFQRIASTIFTLKYRYLYFNEELPQQNEIVKNFFGSHTPDLWEIESNADLLLVNCYQALGNSRPVGPTTVYMGGIHQLRSTPALSWNLQKFLDKSLLGGSTQSTSAPSSGVVYINLGELLTRAFVETQRMEKLLNIVEKSSFDIVLNLNGITDEIIFNTTANIYQSSELDQESILAHQNVKLFITPGGQRDIEDAIHHKVPILGLTFSSNWEHYLVQIVKHDAGIVANLNSDSTTELLAKIEAFAITERYQKNIEKLHSLIVDQPQAPIERAIWWIEYVIRNGGTHHLRSQWNRLSWLQYLLLDVISVIILTTIVCVLAIVFACIRIRKYSNSLPFEKVTRRTKRKML